jgi:MFS transporter, DHA2 family, multidrug resistance protein
MSPIEELFDRYGPAYRWLATGTVMVAAVAVVLSTTIVNVAIPGVMGTFGISQVDAQWISTGFLAAMTATMLLADWANRAFGQRLSMIAALVLFAAGSVLGGIAPNETVLTIARVIHGAAAGIVQPLAMVLLFQVFPPDQRGAAMGIFGIGVVLAPALGPWIGGILIDAFNWRYVFYLGLPFAAIGIVLSSLFLPVRAEKGPRPGFDWTGIALLCIFLGVFLNALTNGQREGWASDAILMQFAIAATSAVAFVVWEIKTSKPMLDMRLFAQLPFASACLVGFIMGAGLFGSTYLVPLFVQTIQGFTPTQAGLLLMPSGFVLVVVFPIAGRMSDRLPAGWLIGAGLAVFAFSSYLTADIDINTTFWTLAWLTVLSQGSGAINFIRQLGGAFGVNLLAVFLERRTVMHADAFAATQTSDNGATMSFLGQVAGMVKAAGLPDFQQLPAAASFLAQTIFIQANTAAFQDGFIVVTIVFVLALLPTWLLHRAEARYRLRSHSAPAVARA